MYTQHTCVCVYFSSNSFLTKRKQRVVLSIHDSEGMNACLMLALGHAIVFYCQMLLSKLTPETPAQILVPRNGDRFPTMCCTCVVNFRCQSRT